MQADDAAPAAPDISVVLVGLNAREYIKQCIQTCKDARWNGRGYEIIYVDNGSRDGSVEMVRETYPEVSVIANPDNRGFCPAANQGARSSRGRHLFFLNDDTIVLDDAIACLADFLESHREVGIVGSRLLNLDGSDQWSGRRFPSVLNGVFGRRSLLSRLFPRVRSRADYLCLEEVAAGQPFRVDWVSAAAVMATRENFFAIGGFAEDYYYWHEAVFSDRMLHRGLATYLHPGSKIIHYEGKGSGPRPYRVRKWHIINFHVGAFRAYCEHHRLGALDPRRWLAGIALSSRAALLVAANRVGLQKSH